MLQQQKELVRSDEALGRLLGEGGGWSGGSGDGGGGGGRALAAEDHVGEREDNAGHHDGGADQVPRR